MKKFAKHYRSINETIVAKYPRHDGKPIAGLDKDVEWYVYIDERPEIDNEIQGLRKGIIELTDESDIEYAHLNRCYQRYNIFDIPAPEEDIFQKVDRLEKLIVIASKEAKDRSVDENIELDKIKDKTTLKTENYGIIRG